MSTQDAIAVSIPEAAALVGVSRAAIYPLVMAGQIPSLKLGSRRLVLVSGLREWAEREAAGAAS